MSITPLADTSDLVELYKPLKLFLKPTARVNISVALPQLKDPGQSISNWDLMERIKKMVHPIQFAAIKVAKSTIEFVRFEADVDNRQLMNKVIKTLDGSAIKVIGFYESLKVRAAEAKSDFPSRHDWDSFFRDAKNMNE
uniref:Uncharacterized protein n=1 Tax=Plectus sambesii TaxID=2011161 RepID=A0A914XQ91_9BILA